MPPSGKSSPRVLLVEGLDDLHVVLHLCIRSENMPKFCIINREGRDNILKTVNEEIAVSDRAVVGILLDADNDLAKRWKKIKRKLQENDIELPDKPNPTGTIIESAPRRPRIGIWLMPDNQSPGELEDFIVKMIPDGDPVWPLSKSYINGIPEPDREFKEGKILRAKVHAWLATREEPRKMGLAIKTEDLDIVGATCVSFVAWLRELFK